MSAAVTERIDDLERKLRALERELEEVRTLAREDEPSQPSERVVARPPLPEPSPRAWEEFDELWPRAPKPPAWTTRLHPDYGKLLSAAGLAWAGGIVTLLGIVFLFVLAVERGWIGPEVRISFGACASLLLLLAAIVLQRRYGRLHSVLGAAGAGIAGGYGTLLAAAVLYDFVPGPLALGLAAAIAAVGVLLALRWSSQLVAGIGLFGAILVPAAEAFDGGFTTVGTAFAALVTAAALLVGILRNWRRLAALAAVAGGLQGMVLVLAERVADPGVVATAAAFAFIFVAGGIGWHVRRPRLSLGGLPVALVLGSGGLVFYSALLLFDGPAQGIALVVAGIAYAAASAWLFRVRAYRDLSNLLFALALAIGAVGVAALLSGATLTYVWAAEAVVLSWLARRVREIRFQVAGLVYLALAIVHALVNEARPDSLFTVIDAPEVAIPSAVALSVACAATALWARPWRGGSIGERGLFRIFAPLLNGLRAHQDDLRIALTSGAAVSALYALAVGIVAAFAALGGHGSFQDAHAVVSGVWGLVGAGALYIGLRRGLRAVRLGSLAWLGVTTAKVLAFDAMKLDDVPRAAAFLAVAGSLVAAGVLLERLGPRERPVALSAAAVATASLGLGLAGICTLLDGSARGLGLLLLAAVYAGASAAFLRTHRDYSTLLWTFSLGVAAAAAPELLSGQWLVAAYAIGAAALAWVGVAAAEPRLQLGSLAYLGFAVVTLLAEAAPPARFFEAGEHPGSGVPAVLAVAVAIVTLAAACGRGRTHSGDGLDAALERLQRPLRAFSVWGAGAVALYGVSLAVLELFELIRPGTIESSFQSGHTAVSATWGVLGLLLLYFGLRRSSRPLQLGGFALFGVSLAKLFFYDLAQLSSITRALSFLAVGAVLLMAGFFYQRLSSRAKEPRSRVDRGAQARDVVP